MSMFTREELEGCIHEDGANSCFINVKLKPGTKSEAFAGLYDKDQIKVWLREQPVDDAANESLIEFVAKAMGVAKSGVSIIYGMKNRSKRLLVPVSRERAIEVLLTIS